jgi:hypothetical protein
LEELKIGGHLNPPNPLKSFSLPLKKTHKQGNRVLLTDKQMQKFKKFVKAIAGFFKVTTADQKDLSESSTTRMAYVPRTNSSNTGSTYH